MRLTSESPRVRWSLMGAVWLVVGALLLAHAVAVRDYLAVVNTQGLRGAPAATTPLQRTVPLIYADAQMWVLNALDLQEQGLTRVRRTQTDNAPFGREVHWSSPLVWLIAGAGHLRHAATGEPFPLATENALTWINAGLLFALVLGFSAWTARRAGAGAGLIVALGMIGHRDFYDGFAPYYIDHHGLITCAIFGLVLGVLLMGGGWWRNDSASGGPGLLPSSRASARRAAIVSALSGAAGLWFSAASVIPAIAIVALACLGATWWRGRDAQEAGAIFDAGLWRLWGRIGALASLGFYLVEYAPAHFGFRLEVNHPLYALAWWGGAELLALLAQWRLARPGTRRLSPHRWLLPSLAVMAAPLVILVGGVAVFAVRDPFVGQLSSQVLEGMSLPAIVRATGWTVFFVHINESLLPALPALGLLAVRGFRDRLPLGIVFFATLGFLAMACWEIRFWQSTSGPQLCLLLVVLAALAAEWRSRARWLLITGAGVGLFVPNAITRILDMRETLQRQTASRYDLAPALHRDMAAALRASQPAGDLVLLACPSTSTGVGYYGRFKTIGTLYWENYAGLRAAAEIFSAGTEAEARRLIAARHITHLALTSEEDFLRSYFTLLHPDAPAADFEKTFGYQLFVKRQIPAWLRLLPYVPASDLRRPDLRVILLQVAFDQTDSDALYHLAVAQLANGEPALAEGAFQQAIAHAPAAARAALALKAANLCYQQRARAAAAKLYRTALSFGENPVVARNLAWLLSTDPDDAVRNGTEALGLAEGDFKIHASEPAAANAYAAALAENGRFDEAVAILAATLTQVRSTGSATVAAQFEQRLAAYRAGRPWRQ
jgi:hypothetical protein